MPRRGSKRSGAEEGGGEEETETTTTTQQPSPRKQSPARSKKAKGGGEGEEKGSTATAAASEGESSSSSSSSSMDIEQSKEQTSTPASSMGAERVIPTEKCGVCGAVEPRGFIVPDYIKRYEENAKSEGLDYKVIEEGRLIFMYRPKVTLHHVEKKEDIQRFYLVMEAMRTPLGEESRRVANAVYHHNMHVKSKDHEHGVHESSQQHKQIISTLTGDKGRAKELDSIEPTLYRVLTIPAKHLPKKIDKPGKYATVLSVSTDRNMIHEEMKERTYGTATRGSRFQDKARIVAEAFYMIVRETHNNKRLSKLVYAIESPKEVTEPMKIFNIQMHGAFIMNVFNPERRNEGLGREARPTELAEYPPYLQQLFEGLKTSILKSVPVDPPSFLNYQHTSLLLIDASDRLHKDLHPLLELVEKEEQLDIEAYGEKDLTEKPLKELNTTMDELPVVGKKLE